MKGVDFFFKLSSKIECKMSRKVFVKYLLNENMSSMIRQVFEVLKMKVGKVIFMIYFSKTY